MNGGRRRLLQLVQLRGLYPLPACERRKLVEDLQRQNKRIKQEDRHHGNNYMDLRFNGCSSDICINEGEKKKDPSLMEKESPWVVKEKLPVKEDTGSQITCVNSDQFWQKGGNRNSRAALPCGHKVTTTASHSSHIHLQFGCGVCLPKQELLRTSS
ncbi:uncharacterized protein ACBT57_016048 isoform 1-T1 [Dama dama]